MRISISSYCSSQVCLFLILTPSCETFAQYYLAFRYLIREHHPPSLQSTKCLSHHCSSEQTTATTTQLIITMSYYSKSRSQTLRRLGVEQLPSLCADRYYDEMAPSSSKGKHAHYEGVSPLAGSLPVRTMPVSR
jgi:hypothetical protein